MVGAVASVQPETALAQSLASVLVSVGVYSHRALWGSEPKGWGVMRPVLGWALNANVHSTCLGTWPEALLSLSLLAVCFCVFCKFGKCLASKMASFSAHLFCPGSWPSESLLLWWLSDVFKRSVYIPTSLAVLSSQVCPG